jgi:hypothetical protein
LKLEGIGQEMEIVTVIAIVAMIVIETEVILVVMLLVVALLWVTEIVLLVVKLLLPVEKIEMVEGEGATVDPLCAVQPGEEAREKEVVVPRVTGEATVMTETTETI